MPLDIKTDKERFFELEKLFGTGAKFKSIEQACTLQLSSERKYDLVIVLGTGQGKSVIFMGAAVREGEKHLATIVIIPLIALSNDIKERKGSSLQRGLLR
jgi:superfamily II DNA helicase RecQ